MKVYGFWREQVYAWLLCWKRFRERDYRYDKNIGVKIAKMLPVDFTRSRLKIVDGKGYAWDATSLAERRIDKARWEKPCFCCFAPSTLKINPEWWWNDIRNPLHVLQCEYGHRTWARGSKPCGCDDTTTCFACADKLAKANNWILPQPRGDEEPLQKRVKRE